MRSRRNWQNRRMCLARSRDTGEGIEEATRVIPFGPDDV